VAAPRDHLDKQQVGHGLGLVHRGDDRDRMTFVSPGSFQIPTAALIIGGNADLGRSPPVAGVAKERPLGTS